MNELDAGQVMKGVMETQKEIEGRAAKVVDVEFFDVRTGDGPIVDVLKGGGEGLVLGKNSQRIVLKEPFFVDQVSLVGKGKAPKVELFVEGINGDRISIEAKENEAENASIAFPKRFVKAIGLSSGRRQLGLVILREQITKLVVSGHRYSDALAYEERFASMTDQIGRSLKDLSAAGQSLATSKAQIASLETEAQTKLDKAEHEAEEILERAAESKSEVEEAIKAAREASKAELDAAKAEVAALSTKKAQVGEELAKTNKAAAMAKENFEKAEKELEQLEARLKKSGDELERLAQESKQLEHANQEKKSEVDAAVRKTGELKIEIEGLKADRLRYSDDMDGINKQGTQQVILYSIIMVLVLGFEFFVLHHAWSVFDAVFTAYTVGNKPVWDLISLSILQILIGGVVTWGVMKVEYVLAVEISGIFRRRTRLSEIKMLTAESVTAALRSVPQFAKEVQDTLATTMTTITERYLSGIYEKPVLPQGDVTRSIVAPTAFQVTKPNVQIPAKKPTPPVETPKVKTEPRADGA